MTTSYIPSSRTVADLEPVLHHFDAERYRWLAEQLRDADRPEAAKLADKWAAVHRETAAKLSEVA